MLQQIGSVTWRLVRQEDGSPVQVGELLTTQTAREFKNGVRLKGGRPPMHAASTGRVWVGEEGTFGYFPSVFGLQWVRGDDA